MAVGVAAALAGLVAAPAVGVAQMGGHGSSQCMQEDCESCSSSDIPWLQCERPARMTRRRNCCRPGTLLPGSTCRHTFPLMVTVAAMVAEMAVAKEVVEMVVVSAVD